jgi:flagellar hook-length control protein FliK
LAGAQTVFALASAAQSAADQSVASVAQTASIGGATATSGTGATSAQPAALAVPGATQTMAGVEETEATAATRTTTTAADLPTPTEQLKVQIAKGVKDGADTISVQLHPDDLGRVEVKLEVKDGQVKATVTADRPDTLQMLKNDASGLQQSLRDAGLSPDANSLSFQLGGGQQQRQADQGQGQGSGRRTRGIDLTDIASVTAVSASSARAPTAAAAGVDINV